MPISDSGSAKFQRLLELANDDLGSALQRARAYQNTGDIGDVREDALSAFLRDRLPTRFAVASGEVVDTRGHQSGQTDILIYDCGSTAPLLADGTGHVLLPAEALLATVEVKTHLDAREVRKAVKGIRKLHDLRPWDAPYAVIAGRNGERNDEALPRIFTTVFAYGSDLALTDWPSREIRRVGGVCSEEGLPVPCIDSLVVLDRGLLALAHGSALIPAANQVLGHWFFNLVNFLSREADRRQPFPWNDYDMPTGNAWVTASAPVFDAPPARRATTAERQRARRKRNPRPRPTPDAS